MADGGYIIFVFYRPPGKLSLAIHAWVDAMSTGDGHGNRRGRNGEFCVTVARGPVAGTGDKMVQGEGC